MDNTLLKVKALSSCGKEVVGYYYNRFAFPAGDLGHFVKDCHIQPLFTKPDSQICEYRVHEGSICRNTGVSDSDGNYVFDRDIITFYGRLQYKFLLDCEMEVFWYNRQNIWMTVFEHNGRKYHNPLSRVVRDKANSVYVVGNSKFKEIRLGGF